MTPSGVLTHIASHTQVYRFGKVAYDLRSRTHIMGILNVTPDSFSDGGKYFSQERAIAHALEMVEEGADIIDVGGESTRPKSASFGEGAEVVTAEEELRRVIPVIEALTKRVEVPISIDTHKSSVAVKALEAGAVIVNDISGFTFDPEMPEVVARHGASAVIMHIKGTPKTMQLNPTYKDLFGDIIAHFQSSLALGEQRGIAQMMIDPGIGFGKTQEHNLQLIAGLSRFAVLGYPVLVGPSRKTFIGNILNLPLAERLEGSLAAIVACVLNGAHVVRVHDVRAAKRAVLVADSIKRAEA